MIEGLGVRAVRRLEKLIGSENEAVVVGTSGKCDRGLPKE
jgi:hypothetical protein